MGIALPDVKPPQNALPALTVPDIFLVMPHLPETVFVIASGPNGRDIAPSIPAGACCIAVNSAITMPRSFAWWLAFDYRFPLVYDWWSTVYVDATRKLFSGRLCNYLHLVPQARQIRPDAMFNYIPQIIAPTRLHPSWELTPPEKCLMPGLLRGGATATGCAVQFAYYGGARNIVLCGADLYGTGHWDGFENPNEHGILQGVWPYRDSLQNLITAVEARGTRVYTLSDTALDLPGWCG